MARHWPSRLPGAMATAYLPLLSCTVGAREALIAACILPFNHTHSVLPTLRTIESCNQNLSMALVNQTFPFRTSRLGEYQHDAIVAVQENAKTQGHDVRGAEPDRPEDRPHC